MYIYTDEGFLSLLLTMDMNVREIVGWAAYDSLKTDVLLEALKMVSKVVGDVPGVVAHSDRGKSVR